MKLNSKLILALVVSLAPFALHAHDFSKHHTVHEGIHPNISPQSFYVSKKSTNYTWDAMGPNWSFTDTTLLTLNDSGNVTILLRKDASNTPISRDTNVYDINQKLLLHFAQNWNSGVWDNDYLESNVFDSLGNVLEYRYQQWVSGSWSTINGNKYQYVYTGNLISEKITQNWNGTAWINNNKQVTQYNAGNHVTEELFMNWDGANFVNEYKTQYLYDANNVNTSIINIYWDGAAWVNDNQLINMTWDTLSLDPQNPEVTNYLQQYWNGSAWYDSLKYQAMFDAFHGYVAVQQVYNGSSWNNYTYESNDKDSHFNTISLLQQSWNSISWYPTYGAEYLYQYNGQNNMTQMIFRDWDASGDTVTNTAKHVYEDYELFRTSTSNLTTEKYQFNFFPNPAVSKASLILDPSECTGTLLLQVFDMNGKEVMHTLSDQSRFDLDVHAFATGLYLFTVHDAKRPVAKGKLMIP